VGYIVRRKENRLPFTPFHLGPGALFKGIGGDRFSFMVFGGSQVLIDIEPGYRMLSGDAILHGPSHTITGALAIGAIATVTGKPISEFVLKLFRYPWSHISWAAAAFGAFLGTFSHLFFDAIMHSDMAPWAPLSATNGLLGVISLSTLHVLCVVLGIVGALLFLNDYKKKHDA
jgi:hypothetical protein